MQNRAVNEILTKQHILDFLAANQALLFAAQLQSKSRFKQYLDDDSYTMILAPTDAALREVAADFGLSIEEFLSKADAEDILANHLSIVPTQKVYPMFTAINNTFYGNGPKDLAALQPRQNTIISGIPIIIINRVIIHEKQYPNLTLNKLGRDPLWLILERSQPLDVINACQTTPTLARLCRDPNTFRNLMALHYPNYPINADARQQYTDITLKNGYAYYAILPIEDDFETSLEDGTFGRETEIRLAGRFQSGNIEKYSNYENLAAVEGTAFAERGHDIAIEVGIIKIYGNGLDQPTKFWIPLRFDQAMTFIHDSPGRNIDQVSVNKADVARYVADHIDIEGLIRLAISEVGIYQDQELYQTNRLNQEILNKLLTAFGFPVPFSREAIFDQLMKVNYFREHPHSGTLSDYGWALMQVTIPKTPLQNDPASIKEAARQKVRFTIDSELHKILHELWYAQQLTGLDADSFYDSLHHILTGKIRDNSSIIDDDSTAEYAKAYINLRIWEVAAQRDPAFSAQRGDAEILKARAVLDGL